MKQKNPFLYRISQFLGFLLGARFFVAVLVTFALYVSTFFLFAHEESLRSFVFDFKVHGIIACAVMSILAGGIINQFYDREKDEIVQPFRFKLQAFLKQKYFLYAYLALVVLSLVLASILSVRVFIFFGIYQFFMWFYSHKLSKVLILNNITFVVLTLYPFFGMLVYYQTFSFTIFWMALFLFLILLVVDILKDILTMKVDQLYDYHTLSTTFGITRARNIVIVLCCILLALSVIIAGKWNYSGLLAYYYLLSTLILTVTIVVLAYGNARRDYTSLTLIRLWIFIGIWSMLIYGIQVRFPNFLSF